MPFFKPKPQGSQAHHEYNIASALHVILLFWEGTYLYFIFFSQKQIQK